MRGEFSLINKTRGKIPKLPFLSIKEDILGTDYNLSIAFVGEKKSQEINKQYRNKNKHTNILSFNLNKKSGELVLCPPIIKKEFKNFNRTLPEFMRFLIIHGMLHLKGMKHGKKMEKAEKKYLSRNDFV